MMRRTLLSLALLALMACAVIQVGPAPAHAEVSAECWAHLAEIPADQKTTPAGDRRYHLEHGEFSPCTEADASQEGAVSTRGDAASSDQRHDDDKKSRYCRKRWFC
ncbi:site-specific recombination directionality factor RDF [Mycobacterium phage Malec]|uniref:RDF protein n=2 Tax=Turbidovirus TaxID=2948936 RepID=A0A0A0RLY7_9CAUD|nr:site-specific recombination directionality factor RDF [Mycobacterium phage Larenn]YP_010064173.1 site-specific recombination directionality factor RDF [Mycobacterium phage Malec]AIW02976.1 hypothetical protein PBI_LARENN_81 [Mycobacterium phage Larenn]AZV00876.1 membrane protein [Mycobacterium phage Malec]